MELVWELLREVYVIQSGISQFQSGISQFQTGISQFQAGISNLVFHNLECEIPGLIEYSVFGQVVLIFHQNKIEFKLYRAVMRNCFVTFRYSDIFPGNCNL